MSEQLFVPWAQDLRTRYLAGESILFMLHGNVNDVYPWVQKSTTDATNDSIAEDDSVEFVTLAGYLNRMLAGKKDLIVEYNISDGFTVSVNASVKLSPLMKKKIERLESTDFSIYKAFQEMERLILDPDYDIALVIHYTEMLLPNAQLNFMNEEAIGNLVRVLQWTKSDDLSNSNNIIIMTTENLADVHRRVTSSSQLAILELGMPEVSTRLKYIQQHAEGLTFVNGMTTENFADVSAGLTLTQLQSIIRRAKQIESAIDFNMVNLRKKAIIEQECHGLVEFVAPKHNFSHVGGSEGLKNELMRIATAIKKGERNQVPMGMLFVGPMGTGKTYIGEAFAGESGLTCIKFKNFREKWVGSTESNFEKILQVVKALGYVLLIIDEADRSMGGGDNDGGTNSRVIARLKEFMSNTAHRGRIVVVMMTNRPDKIDIDLKRPGRLDYKIPFFFPQDDETRTAVVNALIRKNKVTLTEDCDPSLVQSALLGYSAAEIEAVLLRAMRLAVEKEQTLVDNEILALAVQDVIPSRDTRMLEYMELLAVFESSSRQMLPEKYRDLGVDEVQARLDQLRLQLGRRI